MNPTKIPPFATYPKLTPRDSKSDNSYEVVVRASDGDSEQTIQDAVYDINEHQWRNLEGTHPIQTDGSDGWKTLDLIIAG